MAKRRSTARRRATRRRSPVRRRGFAFLPAGTLPAVAATAAGVVGADMIFDRFAPMDWRVGNRRLIAKAGVGLAASIAARRFIGTKAATGLMVGALAGAAIDLVRTWQAQRAMSGLGYAAYPAANDPTLTGLGYAALPAPDDPSLTGQEAEMEYAG